MAELIPKAAETIVEDKLETVVEDKSGAVVRDKSASAFEAEDVTKKTAGQEEGGARPAKTFGEMSLENQIFTWTDWDIGAEHDDAVFSGITMRQKLVGFPEDDQIESVEWTPSCGYVVFHFKDGSHRKYGLKVSLIATY